MKKEIAQKITKAIINTNHSLLDFRSKEAKKQIAWISQYLKPYITKKTQLIDIGCGTGKQSFEAEKLGAQVTGIDCSKEAINFANNIKKQLFSNCQFILEDYTKISFKKNLILLFFQII